MLLSYPNFCFSVTAMIEKVWAFHDLDSFNLEVTFSTEANIPQGCPKGKQCSKMNNLENVT